LMMFICWWFRGQPTIYIPIKKVYGSFPIRFSVFPACACVCACVRCGFGAALLVIAMKL